MSFVTRVEAHAALIRQLGYTASAEAVHSAIVTAGAVAEAFCAALAVLGEELGKDVAVPQALDNKPVGPSGSSVCWGVYAWVCDDGAGGPQLNP